MREKIIQGVKDSKIVAIVRGVYGQDCLNLAKTLSDSGIKFLEVTFNQSDKSQWAETQKSISLLKETLGDKMFFGAGTVTSIELCNAAREAGADFIVSPDTNFEVIEKTVALGMVSMPGALTPTEVLAAYAHGADFVKLFPAGPMGSDYLKAIRGPINHVPILAVGGVDYKNAAEFIAAGACGVGVGGKLVNKDLIAKGAFDEISEAARALVAAVNA